jgi:hypothetical protein
MIKLFLSKGLITEEFASTLLCWKNSGFSVDNHVRIAGDDHTSGGSPPAGCSAHSIFRVVFLALPVEVAPVGSCGSSRPSGAEGGTRHGGQEFSSAAAHLHCARIRLPLRPLVDSRFARDGERLGQAHRQDIRGRSQRRQLVAKQTARAHWSVPVVLQKCESLP